MNKCTVILLLAGLAPAQTKPPEHPPEPIIYEFKNVNADRAAEIVNFVQQVLGPRVLVQVNGPFKAAIIHPQGLLGPESAVAMVKAEELLKRYDVTPPPEPRIDFVAYLVRASDHQDITPGQPIPPAIEDAVAEMRRTFAYTHYSLLDTVSTEVHHHTEVENMVTGAKAGPAGNLAPFFYQIAYGDTTLSADGKTVLVNPFKFSLRIPDWPDHTGITTDLAIREGQKLVLGRVRTSIIDSTDIFLVLTVKLH
ncbi:MAG TPA: hypothetical protein VME43_18685 [Bryobacteraceae bacterium]|nr:hypothetical protein [Bryobacteraceae bacterium]